MNTAREWLEFALEDLNAARNDVVDGTTPRIACFNAQQAVEKLLKGALTQQATLFQRTHDLTALEALLPATFQEQTAELDLGFLNDWAVQARYPDFNLIATRGDALKALEIAESAFKILEPGFPP